MHFPKISTLLLILILGKAVNGIGQQQAYWVYFTDKNDSPYSLEAPGDYLSQKSIERRAKQNIPIDISDLPVNPQYIETVQAVGVKTHYSSKWLNALVIYSDDEKKIAQIEQLEFVDRVVDVSRRITNSRAAHEKTRILEGSNPNIAQLTRQEYGLSFSQISQINGDLIHDLGYRGEGMTIAVFDAGFTNFHGMLVFDSLIAQGRFITGYDFVRDSALSFQWSDHGSNVLSAMAGYMPQNLIGTAPNASYILCRTEEGASETISEEFNWISAAEWVDSMGVDVFNTSLGYSLFDDDLNNHSYSEMDGNTTPMAIAADFAASKGILVVNSAGNSGANDWKYITTPADGDSVLAVGAVDSNGTSRGFSSIGPSFDGDVKPNVAARGVDAIVATTGNNLAYVNGTSLAAPIVAGMAACLWQAFPEKTNMEIFEAIQQSAHLYPGYDEKRGYGIPNFYDAWLFLENEQEFNNIDTAQFLIYPNPARDILQIAFFQPFSTVYSVKLVDMMGRTYIEDEIWVKADTHFKKTWNLRSVPAGDVYVLRINNGTTQTCHKIIKLD